MPKVMLFGGKIVTQLMMGANIEYTRRGDAVHTELTSKQREILRRRHSQDITIIGNDDAMADRMLGRCMHG